MTGTIIREGNRQFVKVKYSVDEDDVHFRQYPIPTSENLFKEGDEVEFQVEEERYVYDDGSEERIKWAINIALKFTPPFKAEGRVVFDAKGGNSSLTKIRFSSDKEVVTYLLNMGSGKYKKTIS